MLWCKNSGTLVFALVRICASLSHRGSLFTALGKMTSAWWSDGDVRNKRFRLHYFPFVCGKSLYKRGKLRYKYTYRSLKTLKSNFITHLHIKNCIKTEIKVFSIHATRILKQGKNAHTIRTLLLSIPYTASCKYRKLLKLKSFFTRTTSLIFRS